MAKVAAVPKISLINLLDENDIVVFPAYQRPYSWDIDDVDKLFNNILDFTCECIKNRKFSDYFFGALIVFMNGQKIEVIDGRQRLTSLFLLLRAIHNKIKPSDDVVLSERDRDIIKKIDPILWEDIGDIHGHNYMRDKCRIKSDIINEKEIDVFNNIMLTGEVDIKAKDKYSINYFHFQELVERLSSKNPTDLLQFFAECLLEHVKFVVIQAEDQDTALTIFSTLNDSGMPLSDADIFKAKIYSSLETIEEKEKFIVDWQNLNRETEDCGESIQQFFYYFMMVCKAKNGDVNTSTQSLRDFFLQGENSCKEKNIGYLVDGKIIDRLHKILSIMKVVHGYEINEIWSKNCEICNILDCLIEYPNEYWKYAVITYYFYNSETINFEIRFLKFLRMLTSKLLVNYLKTPTIIAIKSDVLNLNKGSVLSDKPKFNFDKVKDYKREIGGIISRPPNKIIRMMLKIFAYQKGNDKLPAKWEIEHIFPQKWEKKWGEQYFQHFSNEYVKEMIDHLGNKIPLEKKLNIEANNNFFSSKKLKYSQSKIAISREFGKLSSWDLPKDIVVRDDLLKMELLSILIRWENDYEEV